MGSRGHESHVEGDKIMKNSGKMSLASLRHLVVLAGVALCVVGGATPDGLSHAERRVKPEVVLPRDYPDGFHGYGRLSRIDQKEAVIDDHLLKLAPRVTYHTPTEKIAGQCAFKPDDLVGYLTNSERQIISLWLIEKAP
jgi:hypothetical protein